MAECSYARCVQQRRNIRRELQRWTKNMVYIVGLERIAEELMGRRKWKLYQESMSRSYLQPLNNNVNTTTTTTTKTTTNQDKYYNTNNIDNKQHHQQDQDTTVLDDREEHQEGEYIIGRCQEKNRGAQQPQLPSERDGKQEERSLETKEKENEKLSPTSASPPPALSPSSFHQQDVDENEKLLRLKDWTPATKCYFCVDGKLDSEHTTHGVLSPRQSDSDSSTAAEDIPSDNELPPSLTRPSSANNTVQQQQQQITPQATLILLNKNNNHINHHHLHPRPSPPVVALTTSPNNSNNAMTTIENVTSMAALAAAFSSGGGGGTSPVGTVPHPGAGPGGAAGPHLPFYPPSILSHNWYLANVARSFHQQAERLAAQAAAAAASASSQQPEHMEKITSPSNGGEQPLDLSKGSNNTNTTTMTTSNGSADNRILAGSGNNVTSRLPTLDTRHIFNSDSRAKPRMSAVAGRRTYTEDELQAALRDIQSGKLGTRRAAVIYGIPRSTLRNKVYKLALERERESHLNSSTTLKLEDEEAMMDDDKELSGAEEEKEVEKALQAPLCDILRFSNMDIPVEALKAILQNKNKDPGGGGAEPWSGLVEHSEVGPYIQGLLLASQNFASNHHQQHHKPLMEGGNSVIAFNSLVPDFVKKIVDDRHQPNNGECGEKLSRPSPTNSVHNMGRSSADGMTRVLNIKSESDMETDESPSNVILKIPSFKPTSSSNNNNKNGGCDLFSRNSSIVEPISSMVSPPVTSESGSPPILTSGSVGCPPTGKNLTIKDVKDVIAQSISQKFQQNMEQPARRPPIIEMDFKRSGFTPPLSTAGGGGGGGIHSVIKSQSDLSRSYHAPSQQQKQPPSHHHHHSQHQQNSSSSNSSNSGGAGGKGTRPKRGKYRNYDRDSLVEAVRAVQRGEMSVHRAGSYYGVPHSTLEYKVKERHLMRPRKRDPKPNPVDEKIASLKQNDLRISQQQQDSKMKSSVVGVMKSPQKFPPTSPNGMKLPLFEAGMSPLSGYNAGPPFPFWPHPGFHHIPLDYATAAAAAAAGRNPATTTPPFPAPNPEFFASQMMQKLQEESSRTLNSGTTGGTPPQGTASGGSGPNTPALAKSARQIAESLLDGTGSNGSFLDGIIRSSLESGVPTTEDNIKMELDKNISPENMSNKALLDQLCRNSRLAPLNRPPTTTTMTSAAMNMDTNSSDEEGSYSRTGPGSPLSFIGGAGNKDSQSETSPTGYDGKDNNNPDMLHTIELSNDSIDSDNTDRKSIKDENEQQQQQQQITQQIQLQQQLEQHHTPPPPGRIYLKKDLANPDNLQPEMLMRFRDLLPPPLASPLCDGDPERQEQQQQQQQQQQRNGVLSAVTEDHIAGSASSDNDAPQD